MQPPFNIRGAADGVMVEEEVEATLVVGVSSVEDMLFKGLELLQLEGGLVRYLCTAWKVGAGRSAASCSDRSA